LQQMAFSLMLRVLRCVAVCSSVLQCVAAPLQHTVIAAAGLFPGLF